MFEIDNLKLKQVRKNANLKQKDVANRIGKEARDISHYEKGRAKPPADALLNFLIFFNIPPKDVAKKV